MPVLLLAADQERADTVGEGQKLEGGGGFLVNARIQASGLNRDMLRGGVPERVGVSTYLMPRASIDSMTLRETTSLMVIPHPALPPLPEVVDEAASWPDG